VALDPGWNGTTNKILYGGRSARPVSPEAEVFGVYGWWRHLGSDQPALYVLETTIAPNSQGTIAAAYPHVWAMAPGATQARIERDFTH